MKIDWPKKPYKWIEGKTCFISIPFTWNLPDVKAMMLQHDFQIKKYVVGGPAVDLLPKYFDNFDNVSVSKNCIGILQKINPLATRTTLGCPRNCQFCGIGQNKIEGGKFTELNDWPDLPVLIDNNLLASSNKHFDKVIDRLKKWGWCDFNQGLDIDFLDDYHARRIAEIKNPIIRLSLDSTDKGKWQIAYNKLRSAGIAKSKIRSYVLIGYNDDPTIAWDQCNWVEGHGIKPLPMWFHPLNSLIYNEITINQQTMGWTKKEQRQIMGFFYQHRGKRK